MVETRNFRNGTPTALQMDRDGSRYVFFLRSPATSTGPVALRLRRGQRSDPGAALGRRAPPGQRPSSSADGRARPARAPAGERPRLPPLQPLAEDGRSLITVALRKALPGGRRRPSSAGSEPGAGGARARPDRTRWIPRCPATGRSSSTSRTGTSTCSTSPRATERRLTTGGSERFTHGLAEFVAEEEMDRHTGAWWSPDGTQLALRGGRHPGGGDLHPRRPGPPRAPLPAAAPTRGRERPTPRFASAWSPPRAGRPPGCSGMPTATRT